MSRRFAIHASASAMLTALLALSSCTSSTQSGGASAESSPAATSAPTPTPAPTPNPDQLIGMIARSIVISISVTRPAQMTSPQCPRHISYSRIRLIGLETTAS